MPSSVLLIPMSVGLVIFALLISFMIQYVVPALREYSRLKQINDKLRQTVSKTYDRHVLPEEVAKCMDADLYCQQIWKEYATTLHQQKGREDLPRFRTTTPASVFFTESRLIEIPLRVEFFKHLPGILTGVGIIGTFWGLVIGLNGFHPTEDPNEVRMSLTALISGVKEAFIASGIAITTAMLITFLEKLLVSLCHKQVHLLTELIDALYHAGVVEEYLSDLVAEQKETIAVLAQGDKNRQAEQNKLQEFIEQLTNQLTQQHQATMQWMEEIQLKRGFGSIYAGLKSLQKDNEEHHTDLKTTQAAQHGLLLETITAFQTAHQAAQESVKKEIGALKTEMSTMLTDLSKQTVKNTQATLDQQQKQHDGLLQVFTTHTQLVSQKLQEVVQHVDQHFGVALKEQKAHQQTMAAILTDQTQQILGAFTRYGSNLEAQVKDLKIALNQHWDKNAALITQFESSLDAFVTTVNDVNQQIVATVNQIHERMENSLSLIEENANQFERISQQLDIGFEKVVRFYQESGHILNTLRENSELLTSITGRSEQVVNHYDKVNQDLAGIVQNMGGMTATFDHHFGHITEIEKKLTEMADYVITTMDESFSGLTVSMQDNFEAFTANMQTSRAQFDDKLEKTTASLITSVQELNIATTHIQQVNYNLAEFNQISEGLKENQTQIATIVTHSVSVLDNVRKNTTDFERVVSENQSMLALQTQMQTEMQRFVDDMARLVTAANAQFDIVTRGYHHVEKITEQVQPMLLESFELFKDKMETHQSAWDAHLGDRLDAFEEIMTQTLACLSKEVMHIQQVYSNTDALRALGEQINQAVQQVLSEGGRFNQVMYSVQNQQAEANKTLRTMTTDLTTLQDQTKQFVFNFETIAYGVKHLIPMLKTLSQELKEVIPDTPDWHMVESPQVTTEQIVDPQVMQETTPIEIAPK